MYGYLKESYLQNININYGHQNSSLKIILEYTNLESPIDIKNIFDGMAKTGTLISISNLRYEENQFELDFQSKINDILIQKRDMNQNPAHYSLRVI